MIRARKTIVVCAVLLAALLRAVEVSAQSASDVCSVKEEAPRRLELPDGRAVSTDVKTIASSGGSVLAIGNLAYVFPRITSPAVGPIMRDSITGFLMDADGHVSLVPQPPGIRRAFYSRAAAAQGGAYHVLFVTSDDSADAAQPQSDTASIWYARFRGGEWTTPQRVAHVRDGRFSSASQLVVRNGVLSFVFPYGPAQGGGGLVLVTGVGSRWRLDTLRTEEAPVAAAAIPIPGQRSLLVLFSMHSRSGGEFSTQALYETRRDSAWTEPRRIGGNGRDAVTELRIGTAGDEVIASWISWQLMNAASSRLEWLRISSAGTATPPAPVTFGEATFPFEMTIVDDRFPLWLYRGATYGTSLALMLASGARVTPFGTITLPFENPRAFSVWLDPQRLLVLTMKQGREPGEPMVASWATVLHIRCAGSAPR
jgi:hypothetical protein